MAASDDEWTWDDLPGVDGWEVGVKAAVIDGVPAVTELRIRQQTRGRRKNKPEAITAAMLRAVRLSPMARLDLAHRRLAEAERSGDGAAQKAAVREMLDALERTGDRLGLVAAVHNHALENGEPVTEAVAAALNVGMRTATNLIRRAKETDPPLITKSARKGRR